MEQRKRTESFSSISSMVSSDEKQPKRLKRVMSSVMGVPEIQGLPIEFFLLALLHLVLSATHNLWGGISADYIARNFDVDPVMAGYWSSADSILPVVLAPLLGLFIDKVGRRMLFCAFAASCSCAAFYCYAPTCNRHLRRSCLYLSWCPSFLRACARACPGSRTASSWSWIWNIHYF